VAFCPPLIITEPQVDEMFDKFERALDTTLAFAREKALVD
jgi:4-aminobutyrate--pyruvate transaminase